MQAERHSKRYLYRRIVNAKLFIDKYYLDGIDINHIASEACFSKFHFLRLFKQTYRVTPYQYLTALRIKKAKELLRNNTSITKTCDLLGFESISSFNKLFKRHVRVAPSVYAVTERLMEKDIARRPLDYIPACFVEYMHWDK